MPGAVFTDQGGDVSMGDVVTGNIQSQPYRPCALPAVAVCKMPEALVDDGLGDLRIKAAVFCGLQEKKGCDRVAVCVQKTDQGFVKSNLKAVTPGNGLEVRHDPSFSQTAPKFF